MASIKVFVRIRPLNEAEKQMEGGGRCIERTDQRTVKVTNFQGTGFNPYLSFSFDRVFTDPDTQESVYNAVAADIVNAAFEGMNGTIFCYGQTSSGKTFTCVGPEIFGEKRGLLPRIISAIANGIQQKPANVDIRAKVSLVEIYNQKVTDLLDLSKQNLKLRENKNKGVFIEHVTQRYISKAEEGFQLLHMGLENRSVGSTQMNQTSSRSHMLFMITIIQNNFATGEATSARLTLVDLAGSEKVSKTGTQGKSLSQAIKINTSLSALGNVIHSLSEGKSAHIPYRDSKLTRLLQESLGGNSLTRMVVNVSPSTYNETQTVTSLRFGQRATSIKNTPTKNKEYTVEQLLVLLETAEQKIKTQEKMIDEFMKKKRTGGYGFIQNKPIQLHILKDEDEDSDSDADSQNNSEKEKSKNAIFNYLRVNAEEQRRSSTGADNESEESDQESLEEIERNVLKRARKRIAYISARQDHLQKQNIALKQALSKKQGENVTLQRQLKDLLESTKKLQAEMQEKNDTISKKSVVIEKLKQKNQKKKEEIEQQINKLKDFWKEYYNSEEKDKQKVPFHSLQLNTQGTNSPNSKAHKPNRSKLKEELASAE